MILCLSFKGKVGDPAQNILIFSFWNVLYTLSFLFPKLGHMSLNCQKFLFYKHLHESCISRYREIAPRKKMARLSP